jgi:hypothetical protein
MEKFHTILKSYLTLDSSKISFETFSKMVEGIYEDIPSEVDLAKFLVRKINPEDSPNFLSSLKDIVDWDKERLNYCRDAFDPIISGKSFYFAVFENDIPISLLRLQRTIKLLDRGELFLGGVKRKSLKHLLSALLLGSYILFNQNKFGISSLVTRRKESDLKTKSVLDFSNLESERNVLGSTFELVKSLSPSLVLHSKEGNAWNIYTFENFRNRFSSFEQILDEVRKIQI